MLKTDPKPKIWTLERVELLYRLYRDGESLEEIRRALGLNHKSQVSNRICVEQRRGNLKTRSRSKAINKLKPKKDWGDKGSELTDEVQRKKIGSYKEGKNIVNVYEPGFAIGAEPEGNTGCKD